MIPRVIDAKYIKDYTLYLRFPDGSEGEVDFEQELEGEIFAPLKDISYFKNFTVDQELHISTLNGFNNTIYKGNKYFIIFNLYFTY